MANTGYVPILIVAQDENDKYIHIKDAKENTPEQVEQAAEVFKEYFTTVVVN